MINVLDPQQAWDMLQNDSNAVLIDVRSAGEFAFVGHPVGAIFIPWKEAPHWTSNPNFKTEIQAAVPETSTPVILMCRSGQRSLQAAQTLEQLGYTNLYNMEEGFEGALDDNRHRNSVNGWRFRNLPWQQT
jgi:rhodanese-related sulfurtransferase